MSELDYDLTACLEYNPQPGIDLATIDRVLAVWEGENDGDDWRWVLALHEGRCAFVQGGCDYTGWDCQSWATSVICATPEEAAAKALGDVAVHGAGPASAGLGHSLALLTGRYMENAAQVHADLVRQLAEGKEATWRESMDGPLGGRRGLVQP